MSLRARIGAAVLVTLAVTAAAALPARAGGRSWPARKRYVAAMYNSGQYLRDPKLAGATISRDRKERPIVYSGSFSSVFKLRTTSGRRIAVRVFHPDEQVRERQDVAALGRRYKALGAYLGSLRSRNRLPPELVEFAYVEDGIRIDGESLPIMKLPWVTGRNLDDWIDRRLKQGRKGALGALARNWRASIRDMRTVGIAHGDLHHGNIVLEPDGVMRFLDYDSMYAPPLAGLKNSEIGHPNFQHPKYHFPARSRPFDGDMDNFSALVIYVSLLAIEDNPSLWATYHNDYNLIFEGERDLASPDTSPVFRDILASKNAEVRNLTRALMRYAKGEPQNVPSLERAIKAAEKPWYQRPTP
ncbi:MAG TPA: phosphotransferase [Kofleriaceae bacterium]|nr:phosphotransferase [Kofleriaceae bacterium]